MSETKEILIQIQKLLDKNKNEEAFRRCIIEIKKNPHIAQLWVFLGQTLYFMGYGNMAKRVFNRAVLLDPKAKWAADIPELISRIPEGKELVEVTNLFKTDEPTITAAILCKNEERCIGRCLSSLENSVDEILVIDTGSTDNTLEIVKTFKKARVIKFEWCDDFSAARNFGLSYINTKWVIWIDADEYLDPEDVNTVREVAGIFSHTELPCVIGVIIQDIIDNVSNDDYGVYRMFRVKDKLKFWGQIHERVGGPDISNDSEIYRTFVKIRFFHDGYSINQLTDKNKIERNLSLLEKSVEEDPENVRLLYFYGRELYAYGNSQKAAEILKVAEEACVRQNKEDTLVSIRFFQIKTYIKLEDYNWAEDTCLKVIEEHPNLPDVFYYLSYIQFQKAKQLLKIAEAFVYDAKKAYKEYSGHLTPDSDIKNRKLDILQAEIENHSGGNTQSNI